MIKICLLFCFTFLYSNADCVYLKEHEYLGTPKTIHYTKKLKKEDTLYYHAGTANINKIKENLKNCSREDVLSFKDDNNLNLMENLYLDKTLNKELAEFLSKEYNLTVNKNRIFDFLKKENIYIEKPVMILLLKEKGLFINELDQEGNSFLHIVVKKEFFELDEVENLLSCGIKINIKNKENLTALNILEKELNISTGKRKIVIEEAIKLIKKRKEK